MKWKNEAMEKLRRYNAMCAAKENISREIERLRMEASAIRRADPSVTPVRGSGDPHNNRLLNNIAQREELDWNLKLVKSWLANTERGLLALPEDEQRILRRMFLAPQPDALSQLCAELGAEQSTVYRKRDQALEHFAVAMYGFTET